MKKLQDRAEEASEAPSGSLDLSVVAALAKIASQHDLSEVEIEHQGLRVRVARERAAPALASFAAPVVPAAAPASPAPAPAAAPAEHPGVIKSPMVGTVYLRASPETKPFVERSEEHTSELQS